MATFLKKFISALKSTNETNSEVLNDTVKLFFKSISENNSKNNKVNKELAEFIDELIMVISKIDPHTSRIKTENNSIVNISEISNEMNTLLLLLTISQVFNNKSRRNHILNLPTNNDVKDYKANKIINKLDTNLISKEKLTESIKLDYNYDAIKDLCNDSFIKSIINPQEINNRYFEYLFYIELKRLVSKETQNYWKPLIEILRYTKNEFPTLFRLNINLDYTERKTVKTRFIDFEKSYINIRNRLESLKK